MPIPTTRTIEFLLEKADEHERKAVALRLAAEELNGQQVAHKQNGMLTAVKSAIKLRKKQREPVQLPAPAPVPEPEAPAVPLSGYQATKQRRAEKNQQILRILREHGEPMRITELAAATRAIGIPSLTGIAGLVRKGLVTARGRGRNKRFRTYRYVKDSKPDNHV